MNTALKILFSLICGIFTLVLIVWLMFLLGPTGFGLLILLITITAVFYYIFFVDL